MYAIRSYYDWGIGRSVATMKDCKWETPLGSVEVDSEAAEEISKLSQFIESDFFSHTREHSLEVQIPILQQTFSNFKILPISLINQSKEIAHDVGLAMAKIAMKNVITSYSIHYTKLYEPAFSIMNFFKKPISCPLFSILYI